MDDLDKLIHTLPDDEQHAAELVTLTICVNCEHFPDEHKKACLLR